MSRRVSLGRRDWGLSAILLILPFGLYHSVFWHRFGLMDDYSLLKTMAVNPQWNWDFAAGSARPLYALLRAWSFSLGEGMGVLPWLRALGVAGVGVFGAGLFLSLLRQGVPLLASWVIGVMALALPGAQVCAGWAVTWPFCWAACACLLAFAWVDGGRHRMVLLPLAAVLQVGAVLTYQTHAFLYLAPLVGCSLFLRRGFWLEARCWLGHLFFLGVSMVGAFILAKFVLEATGTPAYERTEFVSDIPGKLLAWLIEFWPKALNVWTMRDYSGAGKLHYFGLALLAAVLTVVGPLYLALSSPAGGRLRALAPLVWLALAVLAVNSLVLIIAESYASYRLVYPFSVVLMIGLCFSLHQLPLQPLVRRGLLLGLAVVTCLSASNRVHRLIAEPQALELALMQAELRQPFASGVRSVRVIRPLMVDACAPYVTTNEFGLPSTHTDYAAEAMPWLIWHEWQGNDLRMIHAGNDLAWQVSSVWPDSSEGWGNGDAGGRPVGASGAEASGSPTAVALGEGASQPPAGVFTVDMGQLRKLRK